MAELWLARGISGSVTPELQMAKDELLGVKCSSSGGSASEGERLGPADGAAESTPRSVLSVTHMQEDKQPPALTVLPAPRGAEPWPSPHPASCCCSCTQRAPERALQHPGALGTQPQPRRQRDLSQVQVLVP